LQRGGTKSLNDAERMELERSAHLIPQRHTITEKGKVERRILSGQYEPQTVRNETGTPENREGESGEKCSPAETAPGVREKRKN